MEYTCKHCGHVWTPRTKDTPKSCPACKSYRWDREKLKPGVKPKTPNPDHKED